MGNFLGHFGSGLATLLLALWWMFNGFSRYIKNRRLHQTFELQYSYRLRVKGRLIPVEQILKVLFTGLLLFGEIVISRFHYWDAEGHVKSSASIMHVSYYLIFFVHAIIDFCMKIGVQGFPDGMDYFSAGLAFFWNALSLYYHVQMPGKPSVDYAIHVMPGYFIHLIAFSLLLAPFMPNCFTLDVLRCYGLTVMGTWFFNVAFILYKPSLGAYSPPNWDLKSAENTGFIHALLGFHISMAAIIMVIVHQIVYRLQMKNVKGNEYYKVANISSEECSSFLAEE